MTDFFDFEPLFNLLQQDEGLHGWAEQLRIACRQATDPAGHGNLQAWLDGISALSVAPDNGYRIDDGQVVIEGDITPQQQQQVHDVLRSLHPWRKGPFRVFDIDIDTEWRSDWKWNRLADHVDWRNRRVLDVGCGNGYFGWQMLNAGAQVVVGLDPFLLYVVQHELIRRLAGRSLPNYVLPLKDDSLSANLRAFDVTLSMGVLYHRTSPIDHLQTLRGTLASNGMLVLDTLVLDTPEATVLVPDDRYAKMRNVWFIPSVSMLKTWLSRTGFTQIEVIDVARTTTHEQRQTPWMTFESLADFLDPDDEHLTVEGHAGPVRAMLTARAR
jgi:tRNA (mo5U34)-methyltransferase